MKTHLNVSARKNIVNLINSFNNAYFTRLERLGDSLFFHFKATDFAMCGIKTMFNNFVYKTSEGYYVNYSEYQNDTITRCAQDNPNSYGS